MFRVHLLIRYFLCPDTLCSRWKHFRIALDRPENLLPPMPAVHPCTWKWLDCRQSCIWKVCRRDDNDQLLISIRMNAKHQNWAKNYRSAWIWLFQSPVCQIFVISSASNFVGLPATVTNVITVLPFFDCFNKLSGLLMSTLDISIGCAGRKCSGKSSGSSSSSSCRKRKIEIKMKIE